ncbi:polysaccharide biosynthesis/export family protein [Defluviimonas aestuarii]|uniref:polysaccharide biosynthesis/export family protein n=1 Tax=Albidovulum aestuarii TaxID=1130726 RepID=UPI00249CA3B7|nr:polysaccharide biosynthesis/export family protein [Defluviimonas aestuarii]MDI3335370.1 polysaccharide biosynthesis/export family protein [Defluviimonas aestuarii]
MALFAVLSGVSACGLPRSGPTKGEIRAGSVEEQGDTFIIPVTAQVARATAMVPPLGFTNGFLGAGVIGSDGIRPGDVLGLTIWENVDNGLLAGPGMNSTALQEMQVDGDGFIFVPYAGRIKAAGNTPEGLRRIITEKLDAQTPDPQVTVARLAGDGATVSVMGGVGGQGVYPIERPTRTLSAMLAKAGGVAIEPEIAQIVVTRGHHTGRIWLKDLYSNPQFDIALRPGDVILVEKDQRNFTAIGATGAQNRVHFETQELSAIEAIAQVGGLSTNAADPTGVFVLRDEDPATANIVLGRTDLIGPQRIAYILDLTEPSGLFNARDFMIRDGDTVYVTEAPYTRWQKLLSALTGTAGSANALSKATGN